MNGISAGTLDVAILHDGMRVLAYLTVTIFSGVVKMACHQDRPTAESGRPGSATLP
jgi:hypothetical protein